jgi:hypothetical protein
MAPVPGEEPNAAGQDSDCGISVRRPPETETPTGLSVEVPPAFGSAVLMRP